MKSLIQSLFGRKQQIIPQGEPVCNLSPFNHYHNHLALAVSDAREKYIGGIIPEDDFRQLEREAREVSGYSPRRAV